MAKSNWNVITLNETPEFTAIMQNTRTSGFVAGFLLFLLLAPRPAVAQSWDPSTGNFDGMGGFTATEPTDWTGPRLNAVNPGTLTFLGDATHTGFTNINDGATVNVNGAFSHSNSLADFVLRNGSGEGISALNITDAASSSVSSQDYIHGSSSALNVGTISASRNFSVAGEATTNVLRDVTVGGFTDINFGGVVNVDGAFVHNNSGADFSISADSNGRSSALNIANAAGSSITSRGFNHTSVSTLDVASISASHDFRVVGGAMTNVLGDVSVGGSTDLNFGGVVNVGGAFVHNNSAADFQIRANPNGQDSALNITDVAGSSIASQDFVHGSISTLDINSINASRNFSVRDGATTNVLGDVSIGGSTDLNFGGVVNVGGALVHNNSAADFRIRAASNGRDSALNITDVASSSITSQDFDHGNTSTLDVNSIDASRNFSVRDGATTNVLSDVSVGGSTDLNFGGVVNVGGAFVHNNSAADFQIRANSNGQDSALNITDVAGSSITSQDFDHGTATTLAVNAISASRNLSVRAGATTNVLSDVSVAGFTDVNQSSVLSVGGAFVHSNNAAEFVVRDNSNFQVSGNTDIDAVRFELSDSHAQFAGTVTTAVAAQINNGSTIAPGNSVGTTNFDVTSSATTAHELVFASGSNYEWELDDTGADLISVTGDLRLNDGTMLTLSNDGRLLGIDLMDEFDVFNYSGSLFASGAGGQLNGVILDTSQVDGLANWDTSGAQLVDDGIGRIYLTGLSVAAVPEPGSALLLFGAISLYGVARSRRRRKLAASTAV